MTVAVERPPYELLPMAQLGELPSNGYRVVSTFSGAGGSCLGFRLAGFRTVWASEFVAPAAETYRANFPDVPLDVRDVRTVSPEDVMAVTGLAPGELDVLEGSPPCSSFSASGAGSRQWGTVQKYSRTRQRTDDLFGEYVRLLRGLRPRTFVAENVAGLVRGAAKGHFLAILRELEQSGYQVEARVLDAQWLGVPQQRRRLIFVGVRGDLGLGPRWPEPWPWRYTVRDALRPFLELGQDPGIVAETTWEKRPATAAAWRATPPGTSSRRFVNLVRDSLDAPGATVTAHYNAHRPCHPTEPRWYTIAELRRLCGFPHDYVLTGGWADQVERLGRAVPPPLIYSVARKVEEVLDECRITC